MTSRKKKKLLNLLLILVFTGVTISLLNFFLANRLERYLRSELIERVSEATDGFYVLEYDDLSINLLNGELKIEGIRFNPDSAIFQQWEARDSLPETYLKAKVGVIDFTGINLIWRLNYRQLHFNTFEIQSPDVEIFDAYYSDRFEKKTKNTSTKTLYELIQPYMDVLSVRTLNLEHAHVSHMVENPISPILYNMEDASFHAYGFWLDSLSSTNGKLLYSDHFDFVTNQPQTLLTNNEFSLLTDSIRLSTQDSIIYIGNAQLMPQQKIWEELKIKPRSYIDGQIGRVEVKGVAFRRENSLNFLKARSFDIQSSDIKIFNIADDQPAGKAAKKESNSVSVDSVSQSLSLYELISPVLRSVSINQINIGETTVDYSITFNDSIETYKLENFDFHAFNFLVDSTSEQEHGFWYSENFILEAVNMEGLMTARNHKLTIGRIALDTDKKHFIIQDVSINPISTDTRNDYMKGKVDSVVINGLVYNNGIRADSLKILTPDLSYYSTPYDKRKSNPKKESTDTNQRVDVDAILNPFLRYLSIGNINIHNAVFTLNDREFDGTSIYKMKGFEFFASDFLVDERTNSGQGLFFTCNHFGFHFADFDNLLMDNAYRLKIKDAFFSTVEGKLRLEDVKLIPQDSNPSALPDTYISLQTPLIAADNVQNPLANLWNDLRIGSFHIESPDLKIVKTKETHSGKEKKETSAEIEAPFFSNMIVNELTVNNTNVHYINRISEKHMQASGNNLIFKDISWKTEDEKRFSIGEIAIITPEFTVSNDKLVQQTASAKRKSVVEELSPLVELVHVGKLYISDMSYSSVQADSSKIDFSFRLFLFHNMDWCLKADNTYMRLGSADILDPVADIIPSGKNKAEEVKSSQAEKKTIYDALGIFAEDMSIDRFNLIKGRFNMDFLRKDTFQLIPKFNEFDFMAEGLKVDNNAKTFSLDDIGFRTDSVSLPVDNGFYMLTVEKLDLNKRNLQLSGLQLKSPYPMLEFSYNHPKHSDWFDIQVDRLTLADIDLPYYFSNKIIKVRKAKVEDAVLKNFKNQKIILPRRVVPMIYEGLQRAPVKLDIEELSVNNLEVVYEELARKGTSPGKIFFTEMNGTFYGFTNVETIPDQFIRLDAEGKLMDDGYFTATWMLPVDTLNDRFLLSAHLPSYDLTTLNNIITPLAPARLTSGSVRDLKFAIDASSLGANIRMNFLYENLKIDYLKEKDGKMVKHKFYSFLINTVVRDNNPRQEKGKPKQVDIDIVRNPYHSTFNYLWQNLRPAVAESVGISKGMQNFAAGVAEAISKVKKFFGFGKKKNMEKKEPQTDNDSLPIIIVE